MSRKSSGISTRVPRGLVSKSIATDASPEEVWRALTDALMVEQWFGTLTPGLNTGETARLDFGDGDFFLIEDIRLERPHFLHYVWRFLGIGPFDSIDWRIAAKGSRCVVTVTDSEPLRSSEWAQELESGWLDFTERLERFLKTGEFARYDWSREIQAGIELTCATSQAGKGLFRSTAGQTAWLPFNGPALQSGGEVTIQDGGEPTRFFIREVAYDSASCVQFELSCDEWLNSTRCFLELSPRSDNTMFTLRHKGWEGISYDGSEQLKQRKRFCVLWITALKNARRFIAEHCSTQQ